MNLQLATKNATLFVPKKATYKILETISLNGEVRATDLDSYYTAKIESQFNGCYAAHTVPSLLLGATIKPVEPTEAFPAVPTETRLELTTINSKRFAAQLERMILSAATDATRFSINGICFEGHSGKLISTDGHRLHVESLPSFLSIADRNCVLPIDAAKKVAKVLKKTDAEECTIMLGASSLEFVFGVESVVVRAVEGCYPDWRQVEKATNVNSVVDRKALIAALKKITAIYPRTEKATKEVRVRGKLKEVTETLQVTKSVDFGGATVESDYKGAHDSVCIESFLKGDVPPQCRVDAEYLIDALNQFTDDRVALCFTTESKQKWVTSPIALRGDGDSLSLLMPMRVD